MSVVLTTPRLILREMTGADLDPLAAVLGDPETMRYYPHAFDRSEVSSWIERNQQRYSRDGHGLWCMVLRDVGDVIGDCGLMLQDIEGTSDVEVGYHVRRDFWSRGYATEAARACVARAFELLGSPRVLAMIRPENLPSRRVAEKVGMRIDRLILWRDLPHYVYAIRNSGFHFATDGQL